jgi:hypothetical protein
MFDDSGNFLPDIAKFFVRPYPTATYGMPHFLAFDVYSAEFAFEFYPSTEDHRRERRFKVFFQGTIPDCCCGYWFA